MKKQKPMICLNIFDRKLDANTAPIVHARALLCCLYLSHFATQRRLFFVDTQADKQAAGTEASGQLPSSSAGVKHRYHRYGAVR